MSSQDPSRAGGPALTPLPRLEDLPRGEGFEREKVSEAFEAFRRHVTALQAQLRVLQAAPRSAEARAGRGLAQLALKRTAEAEADLAAAVELDPGEAAFHEALGLLRLRAGRKDEALRSLERAVELSPSRRARLHDALEDARKP